MKRFITMTLIALFSWGASAKTEDIAKYVFFLGVDGWGSYSVPSSTDIPTIKYMMDNGCCTLKKRTEIPTVSGPNWAAMFNGAPLSMTGYTDNNCTPSFQPLRVTENNTWPNIFYELRKQRPEVEMGIVTEWIDLLNMVDTKSFDYVDEVYDNSTGSRAWVKKAQAYVKEKRPNLLFVHIDQVDHAGHSAGHGTPDYYKSVYAVDDEIEEFMQTVKDEGLYDESIFIVTSDHGGIGTGHGNNTLQEMETPFVIFGKGVRKGESITNTMAEIDVAPTIARIFHLDIPQCWRGQAMKVFLEDEEGPQDPNVDNPNSGGNITDVDSPEADLMDIVFEANGSASDVSPVANTVLKLSSPVTEMDEEVGHYVLNNENAAWGSKSLRNIFRVPITSSFRSKLKEGFTIECYVKPTWSDAYNKKAAAPFSLQNEGGISLVANAKGEWTFESFVGTGNIVLNSEAPVEKDKWVHLVGIYDQQNGFLHIYVDGTIRATSYAMGDLKLPTDSGLSWFGIGGNPSSSMIANEGFQGRVATARLYGRPITKAEVAALYRNAVNATSISATKAEVTLEGVAYDLSGKPTKEDNSGIVIQNGKKRLNP